MDKTVIAVGICSVLWIFVVGTAITGMVVSESCCTGLDCLDTPRCAEAPEPFPDLEQPSPANDIKAIVTIATLILGLVIIHRKSNEIGGAFYAVHMIADLHLHSKYSRACSKDLVIKNLEKWGRIKGINLLGTADFTHPEWIKELKRNLVEDDTGILQTPSGYKFALTTELSFVYTQDGRGRRIHLCVLAPSFEVVDQITEWCLSKGRVDYDGRPTFGVSCPEFVEAMKRISPDIEIIPAHIWTPWFSLFGSKSGFDTVTDCFQDQTKHIYAMETGLSSDPPMNWRLKQLDKYNLVSNSDSHSFWPWRLGREATMFDLKQLTYKNLIKAIRTGEGLSGTVEVDPNYGKYHIDGHRNCNFCSMPKQTKELNGVCPVCKRPLTIGVLSRVEELADREEGYTPKGELPVFKSLLPLSDMISAQIGGAVTTKKVWAVYKQLVGIDNTYEGNGTDVVRSEYDVLLHASEEELLKVADPALVDTIMKNRYGQIKVKPGYDGEYGVPEMDKKFSEKSRAAEEGADEFE